MRIIPPMHYVGKIPEGYLKKDFFRFDEVQDGTYGVLYSGEKVNVNEIKPAPIFLRRIWINIKDWLK